MNPATANHTTDAIELQLTQRENGEYCFEMMAHSPMRLYRYGHYDTPSAALAVAEREGYQITNRQDYES